MTRQGPSTRDARRPRVGPDAPLQPPPRPGAPDPRLSEGRAASSSLGRSAAAVALLALLAVAVVGVFVFLPRWMASRSRSAVDARPAEPAPAAPPASPKEARETPPPAHQDERTNAAAPPPALPRATKAPPPAEEPGGPEWTRAMSEGLAALDRGQF